MILSQASLIPNFLLVSDTQKRDSAPSPAQRLEKRVASRDSQPLLRSHVGLLLLFPLSSFLLAYVVKGKMNEGDLEMYY